jgi:phosphate transport system substrate-binding protein
MRRAFLLGLLGLGAGCGARNARRMVLQVRGSETLLPLMQRWAVAYGQRNEVAISVSGGGSGTGIAALLNGTADLAMASRGIHEDERLRLRARGSLLELVVATDAITLYVHPSNPVKSVSLEDLHEVYSGRRLRWSFLGWEDRPIAVYSRENSSGTYAFFKERVLRGRDMASSIQCLPGTGAVIRAVSTDPRALGFGGALLGGRVAALAVREGKREAIAPLMESILDGSYPLARPLHVYVRGDAPEMARVFARWLRSTEAQQMAAWTGFFPVKGQV